MEGTCTGASQWHRAGQKRPYLVKRAWRPRVDVMGAIKRALDPVTLEPGKIYPKPSRDRLAQSSKWSLLGQGRDAPAGIIAIWKRRVREFFNVGRNLPVLVAWVLRCARAAKMSLRPILAEHRIHEKTQVKANW